MMDISDIFIFCLSIFIALTVTSAGLYLSDELSPANQIYQLYHDEQVTYHTYHYGIYDNGSVNYAISGANYVMPYALTLPALALPIYWIIDHFQDASRMVPMIFWILFLSFMVIVWLVNNKKMYVAGGITAIVLFAINIILYSSFSGNIEILAIILTNILLYGLFGMMVWKIIFNTGMFNKDNYFFIWIVVLSCSSLLFWVGTLKDHMLVAALFVTILYLIIRLNKTGDDNYLFYLSIVSAIIIWTRPELSLIIIPMDIICLLYKYKNLIYLFEFLMFTLIFSIPMFLNNFSVTGSFFKFPFQAVENNMGGIHFSSDMYGVLVNEIPTYIMKNISGVTLSDIFGLLFYPSNGGVGLIPILSVALFGLLIYVVKFKEVKLGFNEKILYSSSFAIILMYLFTSFLGFGMHTEQGMLPDMRYFSLVYAPLTIASLSVLSKMYEFNYNKMIKQYILFFCGFSIAFMILFINMPLNRIMDIIGLSVFIAGLVVMFELIKNKNKDSLGGFIAIISTIPAVWQILITVTTSKMYAYPMFIPVVEFMKSIIFI